MKTILSLFDFTGNWAKPYKEASYNVIQIDLKLGTNILELDLEALPSIHGVLAAPPCTHFSGSGAQYWKQKDEDGRTDEMLELIDRTLEIIEFCNPEWWCMENPVGRLPRLRPIGKPVMYFNPWEYGDPWTKKTCLWGNFNTDLPRNEVEPNVYNMQGSWTQSLGGKSERTKELRSATPLGFANAFFKANP